jgi:hypothetical protein
MEIVENVVVQVSERHFDPDELLAVSEKYGADEYGQEVNECAEELATETSGGQDSD